MKKSKIDYDKDEIEIDDRDHQKIMKMAGDTAKSKRKRSYNSIERDLFRVYDLGYKTGCKNMHEACRHIIKGLRSVK